ncbi:expressed unknown protein [Seminavis robusta]|uniref:Hedgehog protein Hint domain-containing protein n=1 Tax=Seminavis robusta TaxID=568900 RepID=A0A9N8HQN6_9STRA|nr:expressed unknown protein [Seminavis robusta]|eukprot:Sro1213_g252980.1 n/a (328) ;mRNA; f:16940-18062
MRPMSLLYGVCSATTASGTSTSTTTTTSASTERLRRLGSTEVYVVACFSFDTKVQVWKPNFHRAEDTTMADLQVGDRILTGKDTYEPVYAFGHYAPHTEAEFLTLTTTSASDANDSVENTTTLQVTGEHLIYRQGTAHPLPASEIQVGDKLEPHGRTVHKIGSIRKKGLYAPLVPSGSFLVVQQQGDPSVGIIQVSSYAMVVVPQQHPSTGMAHLQNGMPLMSQHVAIHTFLTPYRMVCATFLLGYCHTYNEKGLPHYVDTGIQILQWADTLTLYAQISLLGVALFVFGTLMVLEHYGWILLPGLVWGLRRRRRRRRPGTTTKTKMV